MSDYLQWQPGNYSRYWAYSTGSSWYIRRRPDGSFEAINDDGTRLHHTTIHGLYGFIERENIKRDPVLAGKLSLSEDDKSRGKFYQWMYKTGRMTSNPMSHPAEIPYRGYLILVLDPYDSYVVYKSERDARIGRGGMHRDSLDESKKAVDHELDARARGTRRNPTSHVRDNNILRRALIKELDAINDYDAAEVSLGSTDAVSVVRHINAEEHEHVDELSGVLKKLRGNPMKHRRNNPPGPTAQYGNQVPYRGYRIVPVFSWQARNGKVYNIHDYKNEFVIGSYSTISDGKRAVDRIWEEKAKKNPGASIARKYYQGIPYLTFHGGLPDGSVGTSYGINLHGERRTFLSLNALKDYITRWNDIHRFPDEYKINPWVFVNSNQIPGASNPVKHRRSKSPDNRMQLFRMGIHV